MDASALQLVHYAVTALTILGTTLVGYWQFSSRHGKDDLADQIKETELHLAVLEERVSNDKEGLEKLDSKIDHILEFLYKDN